MNQMNHIRSTNIWWPLPVAMLFIFIFPLKFDEVGFGFLLITLQSAIFLSLSLRGAVNLYSVFQVFNLSFFGLIPWLHYSLNNVLLRNTPLTDDVYFETNFLIFSANLLTFFIYWPVRRKAEAIPPITAPIAERAGGVFLLALSLSGFFITFWLNDSDLSALFVRGEIDAVREQATESSAAQLTFGMVGRLLPAFCLYYAITEIRGSLILKLLLGLSLLISAFPTAIPRFLVGFIYIPLVLILFPVFRNASRFVAAFVIGLLLVFPFLNQFRRFEGWNHLSIIPDPEFFLEGHFDAYENFGSIVEIGLVTGGRQLIGAIAFFIPRDFWADKPLGSGHELAILSDYYFTNISMPFFAEGFINFGPLGVALFCAFLGYVLGKIDGLHNLNNGNTISYKTVFFFFLIGALFFILRGDLLSATAYLTSGLVVYLTVGNGVRFLRAAFGLDATRSQRSV
jgi:hypothetical protein|tara:strand:- start:376 stop:1737 length:1362 start_codon:yes stop_codon:yes gene_type:complete